MNNKITNSSLLNTNLKSAFKKRSNYQITVNAKPSQPQLNDCIQQDDQFQNIFTQLPNKSIWQTKNSNLPNLIQTVNMIAKKQKNNLKTQSEKYYVQVNPYSGQNTQIIINQDNKWYSKSISECFINRIGVDPIIQQDYNIYISNKELLPNILISKKKQDQQKQTRKSSIDNRTFQNQLNPKLIINQQVLKKQLQLVPNGSQHRLFGVYPLHTAPRPSSASSRQNLSCQSNNINEQDDRTQNEGQQSIIQSLFVVEQKLNDAIKFIKNNKIFQLQEYLYELKAKFSFVSDRMQIKWRLLMAYCKQNRKQFQRAAILYQQVLQIARASPISILVQIADIHHKLAICYTQIKRWNDGITSFANALKQLQKNSKKIKYAQCLNNLGTLYLTTQQFVQAEKCFLLCYQIKRNQFSHTSRKLISTLLNLYQCNLLSRNYEQAQNMLIQVQTIIVALKQGDMLNAGLLRRRGKLAFLKGDLNKSQQYYKKALIILQNKYSVSLQYAQLCKNLATLRLQKQKTKQAKQLLNMALSRFNLYCSKDSLQIQNIKVNLQLVQRLQNKYEFHNNIQYSYKVNDQIKQKSA